jgi:hypothetical protein
LRYDPDSSQPAGKRARRNTEDFEALGDLRADFGAVNESEDASARDIASR